MNQKYCSLVEHYKDTGTTHSCAHQEQCHEMKLYIKNEDIKYEIK